MLLQQLPQSKPRNTYTLDKKLQITFNPLVYPIWQSLPWFRPCQWSNWEEQCLWVYGWDFPLVKSCQYVFWEIWSRLFLCYFCWRMISWSEYTIFVWCILFTWKLWWLNNSSLISQPNYSDITLQLYEIQQTNNKLTVIKGSSCHQSFHVPKRNPPVSA